ncbi:MAG: glycosyltransferase family 39 protein [Methylococcaceae bacterium]|nr:glycosyltransferase family 39 protein [Methylococcaceae bacterium]
MANKISPIERTLASALIAILALLALYRCYVLWHSSIQLYFDEAYYFGWSQQIDFGYYSKPPMIAWEIRGLSAICGEGESCIRTGALMALALAAGLQFFIGRLLFDSEVGFYSSLAFATLPLVSLYSWMATTDSLLILFWSVALLYFLKASQTDDNRYWLFTGIAMGLGLLSKYTMVFFVVCALVHALLNQLEWRRKYLVSIGVAFLIFLPNLIWNLNHRWVSFSHTAEIAKLDQALFHPEKLAEFLGGQFLVFGPVFMAVLLLLYGRGHRLLPPTSHRFLLGFSGVIVLGYCLQALLSRANLNWAVAGYVAATPVVVAFLLRRQMRRLLHWGIAVNLLIGIAGYHERALAKLAGVELSYQTDIFAQMTGWKELAGRLEQIMGQYPESRLLADDRRVLAELIYYVRPHPYDALIWNPGGRIANQYHITSDIKDAPKGGFLFVTQTLPLERIRQSFEAAELIEHLEIPLYPDRKLEFDVYRTKNFLAYRRP